MPGGCTSWNRQHIQDSTLRSYWLLGATQGRTYRGERLVRLRTAEGLKAQ
jgi:hypothetical protein